MKINILIVLYKKSLDDSIAFVSLLDRFQNEPAYIKEQFSISIWNNSPEFKMSSTFEDVRFFCAENEFLPNIYNQAAGFLLLKEEDLLLISDDDTDYSTLNLEQLLLDVHDAKNSSYGQDVGVFLPKIYSNNILVSPGKRFLFKGRLIQDIQSGIVPSKNMLAINSGLIITYDCFKKMKPFFNPNLRFYGTDTDFFVRYERFFSKLYVLDFEINHSLSEHSKEESIDRALFRWQDHFYATRLTFKNQVIFVRFLLFLYIFYMKVKLSCRYKSLKFWNI